MIPRTLTTIMLWRGKFYEEKLDCGVDLLSYTNNSTSTENASDTEEPDTHIFKSVK